MSNQFCALGAMKTERVMAPVSKLFGIQTELEIPIWIDSFNPAIPDIENYLFPKDLLKELLSWIEKPSEDGYWLFGHLGTGKSSVLEQLAARVNLAVYTTTGSETKDMDELIYNHSIINGTSRIELGALAKAFAYGGLFIFNELDYCQPHHIAALNDILSGKTLTIPKSNGGVEILKRHPCFYFAATSNTNGTPDDNSPIEYHGTGAMNPAFKDRFFFHELKYMSIDDECEIIKEVGFKEMLSRANVENEKQKLKVRNNFELSFNDVITTMLKIANDTRDAVNRGEFDRPLTLRCLKRWITRAVAWNGSENAPRRTAESAFLAGLSSTQRITIEQFCSDRFGDAWGGNGQ